MDVCEFRELVENCVVYGDRGYRGCEGVIVCDSKDMREKGKDIRGWNRIRGGKEQATTK